MTHGAGGDASSLATPIPHPPCVQEEDVGPAPGLRAPRDLDGMKSVALKLGQG